MSDNITVLMIDDEDMILELVEDISEILEYDFFKAKNSEQAIKVISENLKNIDIIILDMNLGDEDGRFVFDKIIKNFPNNKFNIIVSTGYEKTDKIQKLIDDGVKGYIQKPFKIEELKNIIEKFAN